MTTLPIDAVIHPSVAHKDDLREYMVEPWKSRPFPSPHRYLQPTPTGDPPFGEWLEEARPGRDLACSDPSIALAHLDRIEAQRGILVPLTRGLLADTDVATAICAATNDWLADRWLAPAGDRGRFLGSIRVNPTDPDAAIEEIRRWRDDPRMVQVAVPLESRQPYGQRVFSKLWEAAAEAGLPVAVRADGGSGAEFFPTVNGFPTTFAEYAGLYPLNYVYHLTSLIAEGVFERLPNLRFVFQDGGYGVLLPLMWRMDMDWAISKIETPWLVRKPSEYLADHVRFITSRFEAPTDLEAAPEWLEYSDAASLLMFGSHFPHWTTMSPDDWSSEVDENLDSSIFVRNAIDFYDLDLDELGAVDG